MITLLFIILFAILALYASTFVRKYSIHLYIGFTLLAILAFIIIEHPLLAPVKQGAIGLGLFYLVMLAGALKNKTRLKIALMKVRKEYSIIGFIVITPHALHYTLAFIDHSITLPWLGFIAYGIMIPLFITSFTRIRKRMAPRHWKSLQRLAYIVYIGLFIHLILNASNRINMILYIVVFAVYFILKAIFEYKRFSHKKRKLHIVNS
jgi:DMSO/TMAO reductase YedYZ heme-binding membrane subunit